MLWIVVALVTAESTAVAVNDDRDSILNAQFNKILEVKNNDLPLATQLCRQYIAMANNFNRMDHLAKAYNELGYNYHMFYLFDSAYWAVDRAKEYAVKAEDSILLASATINKGLFLNRDLKHFEAYMELTEGAKISKDIGYELGLLRSEGNIGNIFLAMEMPKQARLHYEAIMALEGDVLSTSIKAAIYSNIGQVFLLEGDSLKAKEYYVKAIRFAQESRHLEHEAVTLAELIDLLMGSNEWDEVRRYNDRFKLVTAEINSPAHLGSYLTKTSLILQRDGYWAKALNFALEAVKIGDAVMDIETKIESHQALYKAYEGIGNSAKALEHLKRYHELIELRHKSFISEDLQRLTFETKMREDSLLRAQEQYKLDQKHKETLARQKTKQQLYLGGGILALMLAGGFYSRSRYIKKSRDIIANEKERSESLLLNILPVEIAEELKVNGEASARDFDGVSILFTDFKEFTQLSGILSAKELVAELNFCFKAFDAICEKYGIEKIKTLGDSYMAAGGLPVTSNDSAHRVLLSALEMQELVFKRAQERHSNQSIAFEMRAGIHTGPVVAGIVGAKKFQYDVWGDTVNTASRMESAGEVGKVNISQATYELIKDDPTFTFEHRGKLEAKGKGQMDMYFVSLA